MRMRHRAIPTLLGLAVSCAATVNGQSETTQTLIQGEVDHGFLVAPDFKFTDVDGEFANLAGAYGGWVIQRKLLLGGGVYTLTNGEPVEMTYGGGVVEYFVNPSSLVNLSFRGLVGGGTATVGDPFRGVPGFRRGRGFPLDLDDVDFPVSLPGLGGGSLDDVVSRFRRAFPELDIRGDDFTRSSSFFVAEPEANLILNISERFRLSFGGGYRFIGAAGPLNDRLDGFTASAALKMSFF